MVLQYLMQLVNVLASSIPIEAIPRRMSYTGTQFL